VIFYAVVSSLTEKVVEFLPSRQAADAWIERVRSDDEDLAAQLRVQAFEVSVSQN
jgi:hypothetical protein